MDLNVEKIGWKEKALKALDGSIEHWRRLMVCETSEDIEKEGCSGDECPCCDAFFRPRRSLPHCGECPIAIRANRGGCHGTPYYLALEMADDAYDTGDLEVARWRDAAQAEIDYLLETRRLVSIGEVKPR